MVFIGDFDDVGFKSSDDNVVVTFFKIVIAHLSDLSNRVRI